jgi:hypothetical protein
MVRIITFLVSEMDQKHLNAYLLSRLQDRIYKTIADLPSNEPEEFYRFSGYGHALDKFEVYLNRLGDNSLCEDYHKLFKDPPPEAAPMGA